MVFSAGGSLTNFLPGEHLVVGDPPGDLSNDVYMVLRDASPTVVDDVEIGDDPEGDGAGDGAPDGLGSDGNATGLGDESVARSSDSGDDVADFAKQATTIGESNGPATGIWAEPTGAAIQGPRIELMGNPAGADMPSIPIAYHVDEPSHVRLTIHDVRGRVVALLFEGNRVAGGYRSEWNRDRSASGLYFVHLVTSEHSGQTVTRVKKLTLVN
jgi:hypothetical protein